MNGHTATEVAFKNGEKQGRADAVKEFAVRLHERFGVDSNRVFSNYNIHRYIDQIAKELAEGEK